MMGRAGLWLSRSGALALALGWRSQREGLGFVALAMIPFVAVLSLVTGVPLLTGGRGVNGAATAAAIAARMGARSDTVAVGVLLMLCPGLIALFVAVGSAQAVRGLIGAEVSRGGLETLLSAPYPPGNIVTALLVYVLVVTAALWAALTALAVVAVACVSALSGDHLRLGFAYVVLALALPLFAGCAGAALALLLSMRFPRLTQPGVNSAVAGGSLANAVAVLPAIGVLLTLVFGAADIGSAGLVIITGGASAGVALFSVALAAWTFRPESVLDS